jgi:hypothetical protein
LKLRSKLIWTCVGALLVVVAGLGYELFERRYAREQQFIVLIEPPQKFNPWSLGIDPPGIDVKRIAENEKLRSSVPPGELYVGKLAHECGVTQQLMQFPQDGPSDVFIPMATLNEESLACLVNRARREKIAVDFRRGTLARLPYDGSDALRRYYNGVE